MTRVVVVGGGVVGIVCALELLHEGHQVTVLDPGPVGEGASLASCGSIAVSEVVPLSKPGLLAHVPGWLVDPLGPMALRASSALRLMPWFLQFLRNTRLPRILAIRDQLAPLGLAALADLENLLLRHALSSLLRSNPVIELYDSEQAIAGERRFHDLRREAGFQLDEISGDEAREIEPAIAQDFARAVVLRDWCSIVDPLRFVVELHRAFVAAGGVVESEKAVGFDRDGSRIIAARTQSGRSFGGDEFVLAAGAWSRILAGDLGIKLMVEGVIGYQVCLKDAGVDLKHALIYAHGGFGITPYESGLAVAGSIEFASLDAEPNWNRADILVEKAQRVLPGIQTGSGQRYMGRRPLTPDTKPVIGRSSAVPNLAFATGHGQLGLTLCATTARLIGDLIAGRPAGIDISAFSPDRF